MRTTVTLQAEGTVRFEGDRYKCLMIRKRVRETVRKTEKQGVHGAIQRGEGKTRSETAEATCQCRQVYTQGIGLDGFDSETIPSQLECFLKEKEVSCDIR